MTINRKKLVKLLVDKTNMKKAEVEAQLDELTHRILDAANRGKALEIKDFGLFYFDEEGELSFKPSDQLDTEINFQYAGMEPVELRPSKQQKSPATHTDQTEESEIDAASDPQESSDPESKDDVFGIGKTLSGHADEEPESVELSESDPFDNLFQDPSSEVEPRAEENIRKAGTTTEKKSPKTDQSKRARKKKPRDPMTMIIIIVVGIVVLIVGYLMLSDYLEAPEPAEAETEQPVPIEEPPAVAEPDITDPEEPVDQAEAGDDNEPAEEVSLSASSGERYGLHGNYIEASGIDYTIVVHSLRDPEHAERIAEGLRQEGYRTVVTERDVDDRVVFRVGIGQFETIQSALNEAELLPEPYRNQNFIHRIQ